MPVLVRYQRRGTQRAGARRELARVKHQAGRMLSALGMQTAQLSVLLCDDDVMRALNCEHRGMDRPTDVLAFAMHEGHVLVSVHDVLGDVVISLPTATRQARAHGWSAATEACLLLAHGLLHLLGFDHATRNAERRMTARTHLLMAAALSRVRSVEKPARRAAGARASVAKRAQDRSK